MAEIALKDIAAEWVLGSAVDWAAEIGIFWGIFRASFVVPILRICLYVCLVMSTMLSLEWAYLAGVILYVKVFDKKPEKRYEWEPMMEDSEAGWVSYPMILVQIPLFNEKEVYKLSIGAACNLSWPADRLLIQIMDGSTDIVVKDMVEKECKKWASQGINIRYQSRQTRGGFKAGSLKEGLAYGYVKECEHVAIFDADFQPEPDFLLRSVPFLIHNQEIALVQARWRFVNADDSLLTRLQEMSLDFHFTAEQESGSTSFAFFGFNGSAGIWRISALNDAGGWDYRTTAEDMDLAVRAGLKGWKLVYVSDLEVKSELPSTLKAYRSQQYRWYCGPTNLFRKIAADIATSNKIRFWKKAYMIYSFFFVRKVLGHTCVFLSYCIVLPLTILLPEVDAPKAGAVFVPCIMAAINYSVATPRSLHLVFIWILFMSTMSFHLTKAVFTGLLGTEGVNQWTVTAKVGETTKNTTNGEHDAPKESWVKMLRNRQVFHIILYSDNWIGGAMTLMTERKILLPEIGFALFLFLCGCYGAVNGKHDYYYIYLFLQSIAFAVVGFGFIGKTLPGH